MARRALCDGIVVGMLENKKKLEMSAIEVLISPMPRRVQDSKREGKLLWESRDTF